MTTDYGLSTTDGSTPATESTSASVPAELRAFLRNGRVSGFPARSGRRRRLLEHVVQAFASGPDHVTLRRYLVDARLLVRADGIYRRVPGGLTSG